MSERSDWLPDHIIKNLVDKSADKRDSGTKELIKLIQQAQNQNKNDDQIQIMKSFCRFIGDKLIRDSDQLNYKKGGLQALHAIALSIQQQEKLIISCLGEIVGPMLECFKNKEDRVRYAGIEYMFLTCKCFNDIILLKFDEIFEKLINNIIDTNDAVKKAATSLDNCLKSLVTSSQPEKQYFKIDTFIPIISKKITAKNHLAKQNLITWISTLNSIPYIELFDYINQFLKELFLMMGDSSIATEAKTQAKKQLEEFQKDIERYTQKNIFNQKQELQTHRQIMEILIQITQEVNDTEVLKQVFNWIQEYLRIIGKELEQDQPNSVLELSGNQFMLSNHMGGFLQQSVFDQKRESVLQQVLTENLNRLLQQVLCHLSHEDQEIRNKAQDINQNLLLIMGQMKDTNKEFIDIMPTIQQMLKDKNSYTAEKALDWMKYLLQSYSDKILPMIDSILDNLIERLRDAESQVIENVMDVLTSISHDQYFDLVIEKILNVFYKNKQNKKSELIIKKLCQFRNPEQVYTTFCAKLLQKYRYNEDNDIEFVGQVIQCLEYLLLSDRCLQKTRLRLRQMKYDSNDKTAKQTNEFFQTIYRTFCFNPVSAISLSFLAEEYELSYNIILNLSEFEVDVETLVQVARLVLQLESPVFAYLRLQLLESSRYPYLLKSLQGLMMLLPQTPIQNQLKQRLKNIDIFYDKDKVSEQNEIVNRLDTQQLLLVLKQSRVERFNKVMQQLSNHLQADQSVIASKLGPSLHILLNRPKTLNSLNEEMIHSISKILDNITNEPAVILQGSGKGLCAGGDVKSLYFAKTAPTKECPASLLKTFFYDEYTLDYKIATLKPIVIALMDGIVMGGGVGLSINAPIRIATEKSLFAMPEGKLGLFTDVGGGYFLSRLRSNLGPFLGLTGYRLKGADLLHAGVADHYIEQAALPKLLQDLSTVQDRDLNKFKAVVQQHQSAHIPPFTLHDDLPVIEQVFAGNSLEQIYKNLEQLQNQFGQSQLKALKDSCPISLRVIFEQIQRGKKLNYRENLIMDYRIACRFMAGTDVFEGIKQILIDKNHIPSWSFKDPLTIPQKEVQRYFEKLPENEELKI